MSAIQTHMDNWKSDWRFMEQPEKDLYLSVEDELAALQAERDMLFQTAVLAFRIVEKEGIGKLLEGDMQKLDSFLTHLPDELWDRIDAAAMKVTK